MSADWGYDETNGPETWATRFPMAAGSRQSPVDIATALVASDQKLDEAPLRMSYPSDCCLRITNPGYGWRVDVNGENSELIGGPLSGKYKLEQFHCHWGCSSDQGSEHTVDGKAYAGELHLVHWNCEKYSTFQEAAGYPDGLAVLAVFLQVQTSPHEEIKKITTMIPNVIYKSQTTDVLEQINISKLLPTNFIYWTYLGSLTTPPCSESVIWIVFKEPILVTEEQLAQFRTMRSVCQDQRMLGGTCQVVKNYRPPLPLGNRILRECGSI